ncbi:acyl-CoA dehydrogenase C-terminal domain-containing protein [Rhodoblastus sp.]|uniref:acyl-CoA dehydrogenase C-terminal domain-containing protein n=1 Tax=Rhodoblastus sp. TaxID=1962975 RepID=UPI003F9E3225
MPSYKAPVEDALFLLNDVLRIGDFGDLTGYSEASPDIVAAVLEEAGKLAEEQLQPLNLPGDQEGCHRAGDGSVRTPKGFKAAFDAYAGGGWISLPFDPEYGGQGLPYVLAAAVNEFFCSANMALSMYPGLTAGAVAALLTHGSEELKQLYAPKMIEGRWTGTMNLTEPHCGTDLGMLKTRATRRDDGSFAITGQKIFISAGEHDLTENIVHLVLARIEGAPAGVKGISLFVVPKFLPDAAGNPGIRNAVSCGSIEHKMGIHGNSTCVMNFDGAQGFLLGEENRGLNAMFVMMNEARLMVGVQGLSMSEVAYQNAAAYARERLQGRSLSGAKNPEKPADPLLVHPDIRRALLEIRGFNEAGRALALWLGLQSDIAHRSPDAKAREKASDLLGLMTPVLKGVMTDRGFDNCVKAQQVFGGHGYIVEWGMEQFVRDARIAQIYEGANGIQALDLVGRKLPANGGRAITSFLAEVGGFLKANDGDEALKPLLGPLSASLGHLQQATLWLMKHGASAPDNAGAAATDYMHLLGLVTLAYLWAKMSKAAHASQDPSRADFLLAKRTCALFFAERILPETALRLARIATGAEVMMSLPAELF